MSEKGKGSMLLPLGIGAGLLILLTSMKKKEAAPVTAAIPDDAASLLPQVNAGEAAMPQIDPAPAPSYAQAQAKTAPSEDSDEEGREDPEAGEADKEEEDPEAESADEDEGDSSYSSSSGSRSGGGGNYTPYSPSASINTSRQATSLPANTAQATTYFANSKPVIGNKAIRFQSDQAKLLAMQKARNNKSLRFQSDQAKKFAQRSGVKNPNPLIIGNGKPRMGAQLPASYRPGATTAIQQPIAITSQSITTPAAVPAVSQSTIFPLKFGTTSAYVKEVQRKLGVSATGYFGTMTRAAILKRFRVSEISETLYRQIITGKAPVAVLSKKPVPKIIRKVSKPIPQKHKIVKRK
ncbi:peptidoglycan-binding domain-containing protein [Taibaiella soli]|uniref:Peptidoglycan binding-like domain-containing protein n=1 Tax=Taibaiella soli TaxID=1649169 RepID=A0A2W2AV53_9BACT|nr:hypothetical protein [Taibaiella soli]PZF71568.1 hypothetical protein DN068_15955 [Taibaiella soli]